MKDSEGQLHLTAGIVRPKPELGEVGNPRVEWRARSDPAGDIKMAEVTLTFPRATLERWTPEQLNYVPADQPKSAFVLKGQEVVIFAANLIDGSAAGRTEVDLKVVGYDWHEEH